MIDNKDNLHFECDTCTTKFTIDSGGFLGEPQHLSQLINDGFTKDKEVGFSCSPFTTLVSLCNVCLTTLKNKKKMSK